MPTPTPDTADRWPPRWLLVVHFVGFEAAWFAGVIAAARGEAAWGIAAVAVLVASKFAWSRARDAELVLLAVSVGIGFLWDSALGATGWIVYASPGPWPLGAPAWILAMWALFSTLLREPLHWLHGRPALAALLGAVGGPLSYAGAARLEACVLVQPLPATAALAIGWAVITPVLLLLARRLNGGLG